MIISDIKSSCDIFEIKCIYNALTFNRAGQISYNFRKGKRQGEDGKETGTLTPGINAGMLHTRYKDELAQRAGRTQTKYTWKRGLMTHHGGAENHRSMKHIRVGSGHLKREKTGSKATKF